MSVLPPAETILRDVRVPRAVLARPDRFGGRAGRDCLAGDLVIRAGKIAGLRPGTGSAAPRMVLPALVEPHVHLDKCHTVYRLGAVGGDLAAAIVAQRADRQTWTEADIRDRAGRGLDELIAAGCGAVRSHVDWGDAADPPPLAWPVLRELAQDRRGTITLQCAALIGADDMARPGAADRVARRIAADGGVLGCFVLDQPGRHAGIRAAFRAAQTHGLSLDFHVDEGLDAGLDGLETIADAALETGFDGPVLCGHASALMTLDGEPLKRVLDKVARAGLFVAALPATNLYLQGRGPGTPDRRGVTRLRELRAAGVRVVTGTDNVGDAFCPLGRHDPRAALALAVLAAHLDPPLGRYLPMITTDAAAAIGREPGFVDTAAPEQVLVFEAATVPALLSDPRPPLRLADAIKQEMIP